MAQDSDKRPPRRIDEAAKLRFLKGVRAGQARDDAAAGTGFGWHAFYQVRRRDPIYEFAWLAAMELSEMEKLEALRAAERLEALAEDGIIGGQNRRLLQRKPRRGFKFDERRQQIFLDHFAGTADEHAAAEAAGVAYVTVRAKVRSDPGFAALRDEALRMAYAVLEAEALRQRLEGQQKLRANLQPTGEIAEEFERVMKLLARYDRRDGRVASREHSASPSSAWSFEDSIKDLDRALDALGRRRAPFPPGLRDGENGSGGDGGDGGAG
ncbi:MAG TPA: hypothetical protein VF652_10110 [Allosphingosinicella sp.]